MHTIKVNIENRQKAVKVPTGMRLLIRRCCHAVLTLENFEGAAEVDIMLVDNNTIRAINNEQRHIDAATDVLSFPLSEDRNFDVNPETGNFMLGDVVLSIERAVQREVGYLPVHSMLHLFGYDHVQGGLEAVRMREREEAVMNAIGLPRGSSYVMNGDEV